jgi:hypothetical protein
VQDADDAVERAAVNGQTAVRARGDEAEHILERRGRLDGSEPLARDHQLSRGSQAEPERAMQPNLFERLEQATVPALRDEELDLLGRVDVAMAGRGNAEQLQQEDAAAVEQSDRRREEPLRPLHRQHCQERHARRILQGERLDSLLRIMAIPSAQQDEHRGRSSGLLESRDSRDKRSRPRRLYVGAEDQAERVIRPARRQCIEQGLRPSITGGTRPDCCYLREPPQAPPRADG